MAPLQLKPSASCDNLLCQPTR